VSVQMESKLSHGAVIGRVRLPERNQPKNIFLRARVPDGWKVMSARSDSLQLKVDNRGTVDISSLKGQVEIGFQVKRL
jgi:hypothetical protein